MSPMTKYDDLAKFLFEVGQLKRVKRSGWWLAGIKDPESVAEHSYRATVLATLIAEMEHANVEKVMKMTLFHDLPETRVNDTHKVAARYVDPDYAERKVVHEQAERLPPTMGKEMEELFAKLEAQKSKEAIIAKDADLLECAIQAREYLEQNYKDTENWMENVKKRLQTESAKKILAQVEKLRPNSWWYGLKHTKELLKHKE